VDKNLFSPQENKSFLHRKASKTSLSVVRHAVPIEEKITTILLSTEEVEKCIRLLAPVVEQKQKYLLSLPENGRYIVKNVLRLT